MKTNTKILLLLLITSFLTYSQSDYYYYNGEKVYLTKNYQYVNIATTNSFNENSINTNAIKPYVLSTEKEERNGEYKKVAKIEFVTLPSNQTIYNQNILDLKNYTNIEGVYPYYTINDREIGTNNFFLVKLNQIADVALLQNLAAQKNVSIIKQIPYMPLWYLLSTNINTTENSAELSAYFYETGSFVESEPVFTGGFIIEPSTPENIIPISASLEICDGYIEPNKEDQWNLFNNPDYPKADINVCGAWDLGYYGQGVKVAVIDTGVKAGITDLPSGLSNVIATSGSFATGENYYYNFLNQGPHGTAVASVIGSKHDGQGMGGIAPEVSLLHVANKLETSFSQIEITQGINEAFNQNAQVYNMSFSNAGFVSSLLADALNNAIQNGRNGKGAILVSAGGNATGEDISQPANHPNVLAVSAIYNTGLVNTNYSFGEELDISAPGDEIVAHRFNGVENTFNRTSAASPHVSGVVALMISANNDISGEGVRNIIRRTAQRDSDPNFGDENSWFSNTGERNNRLGHGIIDATASTLTAETFKTDGLDLHLRNSIKDYGIEPDNVTKTADYVLWNSPDIWVRNNLVYNYNHENPIYQDSGSEAYVYVRVINKSNTTSQAGDATLKLYWSKLHNSYSWPNIWDGTINVNGVAVGGKVPDLNGNINGIVIPSLKAGEEQVLIFKWQVPNPTDFNGIFPYNDTSDFSFLARIESSLDPIISEGNDVWVNAKNNNNIAWKNVSIIESKPNASLSKGINISNFTDQTSNYTLEFVKDNNNIGKAIYEEAEITIVFDNDLYQNWNSNGAVMNNATQKNQQFKIDSNNVIFDNITLASNQIQSLQIQFNFLTDKVTDKQEFYYHFIQRDKATNDIVNAKTFCIKKGEVSLFDANAGDDKEINKTESAILSATDIDEPAIYNWYDLEGNLIYSGKDITVSPIVTKEYKLEVIKESNGFKDYDDVQVVVKPFSLGTLSPNPAQGQVSINYHAEDATNASIKLIELNTNNTFNYILDTNQNTININTTNLTAGVYFVSLVCDNTIIESKTLIKQ